SHPLQIDLFLPSTPGDSPAPPPSPPATPVPAPSQLEEIVRETNVDELTPKEALLLLYRLRGHLE
ncbi:MAG: hypothetical protein O7E57_09555, partial [Gammaproteobacteria bacterium]|nr:hypothetical protein [Gammaproteobacteria bacterium]